MIHILLPYMILPIANALRQIDPSLARAASGLGATPFATFLQVTLPLSMPGVAAGVLLVFVLALGFYITPAHGRRPARHHAVDADRPAGRPAQLGLCRRLSAVLLATALVIIAVCHRLPGVGNAFRMSAR